MEKFKIKKRKNTHEEDQKNIDQSMNDRKSLKNNFPVVTSMQVLNNLSSLTRLHFRT
jgi:hypothetical protein